MVCYGFPTNEGLGVRSGHKESYFRAFRRPNPLQDWYIFETLLDSEDNEFTHFYDLYDPLLRELDT